LRADGTDFDLVFASGVLYHMRNPARTSATNPIGKKTRVNRNFAACQCGARPGRTARTMRCSRVRPVLTLSPGLSQLACKQMRLVAGVNRERLGAAFGSSGLPHIADGWCQRGLRLRPNEGAT
jgi:hypothetical protein